MVHDVGAWLNRRMNMPNAPLSPSFLRRLGFIQSAALLVALLGGALVLGRAVNPFYPVKQWLFFHYAWAWACVCVFVLSSLAAGWSICSALLPGPMPTDERLALSLALGILTFFCGMFVGGMLGVYGATFFLLLPAGLLAFGGPRLLRDWALDWHQWRTWMLKRASPRTPLQVLGALALTIGVVAVYLQCINPNNIGYDARWYHLPIAEHYVAAGGIRRFDEGWYLGTYPQLANLIYAWALEAPGSLFDHVLICAHLEFALFLATLATISILAARLLRRDTLPFAGALVFLFPEILAYDSNLNCGADHVLAFWAPAVAITLIRFGRSSSVREAIVSALVVGGALLTKYQSAYLFAPAALLVVYFGMRWRRYREPVAVWFAVVLAVTSPHWLKNWVYYHDPLYPLLHRYLHSQPFHRGAGALLEATYWPKQFALDGTLAEKSKKILLALVNFSFVPNDWPEFHGMVPIFGSLFTLSLPLLLLQKTTRRVWLLVAGVHLGLAIWYALSHQDRFLQALLPWMAACVAALFAVTWNRGHLARCGVIALVGTQWVWGSDVYFFRTHSMSGDSPIRATGDFLGAAHRGEHEQQLRISPTMQKLGEALPANARVLFHRERLRFGLGRQFIEDAPGWQGGIEYLDTDSPSATRALLSSMAVTHALWPEHRATLPRADATREVVFLRMAQQYIKRKSTIDGWNVGEFVSRALDPSSASAPTLIAWLACDEQAPVGMYTPRELANGKTNHGLVQGVQAGNVLNALARANAAITASSCPTSTPAVGELPKEFAQPFPVGSLSLWIRVRQHAP